MRNFGAFSDTPRNFDKTAQAERSPSPDFVWQPDEISSDKDILRSPQSIIRDIHAIKRDYRYYNNFSDKYMGLVIGGAEVQPGKNVNSLEHADLKWGALLQEHQVEAIANDETGGISSLIDLSDFHNGGLAPKRDRAYFETSLATDAALKDPIKHPVTFPKDAPSAILLTGRVFFPPPTHDEFGQALPPPEPTDIYRERRIAIAVPVAQAFLRPVKMRKVPRVKRGQVS